MYRRWDCSRYIQARVATCLVFRKISFDTLSPFFLVTKANAINRHRLIRPQSHRRPVHDGSRATNLIHFEARVRRTEMMVCVGKRGQTGHETHPSDHSDLAWIWSSCRFGPLPRCRRVAPKPRVILHRTAGGARMGLPLELEATTIPV